MLPLSLIPPEFAAYGLPLATAAAAVCCCCNDRKTHLRYGRPKGDLLYTLQHEDGVQDLSALSTADRVGEVSERAAVQEKKKSSQN